MKFIIIDQNNQNNVLLVSWGIYQLFFSSFPFKTNKIEVTCSEYYSILHILENKLFNVNNYKLLGQKLNVVISVINEDLRLKKNAVICPQSSSISLLENELRIISRNLYNNQF